MQVEVSFAHWQKLTALLRDEEDSYDAVIGRLLAPEMPEYAATPVDVETRLTTQPARGSEKGAYFKNAFLPDGTQLRASYKGRSYYAEIRDSRWVDLETGAVRSSPSQAAYSITGKQVNGWLFWRVKRPSDSEWQSLNFIRSAESYDL